jgi:hypothetical protein
MEGRSGSVRVLERVEIRKGRRYGGKIGGFG